MKVFVPFTFPIGGQRKEGKRKSNCCRDTPSEDYTRLRIGEVTMRTKASFVLAILAILALPLTAAASGGNGGVTVLVNGTQFFQNGTEDPLARLHDAWILPCGADPEAEDAWVYYYVYPHPDETWVDMGFPIAIVDYSWHYDEGGGADFFDVAEGSCAPDLVALGMMYLSTSVEGFYISSIDGLAVNTCPVISDVGYPSPERVEAVCGSLPADIQRNVCYGTVWDTGGDRAIWTCNGLVHEYGERIQYVRNDPDGLPGLEAGFVRHHARLADLGLWP